MVFRRRSRRLRTLNMMTITANYEGSYSDLLHS